jgi:RimJ/RimL family protein N-acetyltransferase
MIYNKKVIGKRIYLRSLTNCDASEKYCSWLNDNEVNKYLETRSVTIDGLKEYINEKNESDNTLFLGIFDKANDKHIGNLKLEPINNVKNNATFSIVIGDKDYWGYGFGTESTNLILSHGFNEMNLMSINLGVISQNKKAIHIYEKLGFKIKEIIPKCMDHDGIKYDKVVMEITKDLWEKLNKK